MLWQDQCYSVNFFSPHWDADARCGRCPQVDLLAEKALQEKHPEAKEYADSLLRFMEQYSYKPTNKIYLPEDLNDQLAWFNTATAARLGALKIPRIDQLFAYGKALVQGCGFVVSEGKLVRYVGYASKLTAILSAGSVLLDATADIDGVPPS
jgi:hypothetical protein